MLERVTLAQVVELVVEVLVNLSRGTVANEETTENTHTTHPEDIAASHSQYSTTWRTDQKKNVYIIN